MSCADRVDREDGESSKMATPHMARRAGSKGLVDVDGGDREDGNRGVINGTSTTDREHTKAVVVADVC